MKYLLTILFFISTSLSAFAEDFKAMVQEINQRLDQTASLYQQSQTEEARETIRNAYFQIFENLEGPIRINFSAQKCFVMEATFWDIRKMMGDNIPVAEVTAKIEELKADLELVLPALESGHKLTAESLHDIYDNPEILPHWQQSFKIIEDRLADSLVAYQKNDFDQAKQFVQQAQYDGYKNTEMEMSIRQNRSAEMSGNINQQFYDLIKLATQPNNLNALAYQITVLIQTIEEQLPNLPATRESQMTEVTSTQQELTKTQDWKPIAENLQNATKQALELYTKSNAPQAILKAKLAYYEQFETSGLEAHLNEFDMTLKDQLNSHYSKFIQLMKINSDLAVVKQQADLLEADFVQLQQLLQKTNNSSWNEYLIGIAIAVLFILFWRIKKRQK